MAWLGLALIIVLACFSFVLLFGAPYLPTLNKQITLALEMADLKAGQTLLELGCGDGRVMIAAAKKGYRAVGYEMNPLLVLVCKIRLWRYRQLTQVRWGNFMTQPWPPCDAIFVFGLQRIMPQLDTKIMQSAKSPVKLVSFAFTIPGRKPFKEAQGLRLYHYE